MNPNRGMVLFAHGARDPAWVRPFEAVAENLREARPGVGIRLAFLEFMTPDLPTAAASLAAAGCTRVDVVPMFLGAGGHVRRDLPLLLQGLREAHPAVRFELHAAIGEIDAVTRSMAAAAAAMLDTP
jgi:sirohydrochlorin cobaltochelatase